VSIENKIVYGILFILVVAAGIYYATLCNRIHKQIAEIARLELRLSECGQKVKDANTAIERQNAAIEAVRVDTVEVVKQINDVVMKYAVMRDTITRSVQEDVSYENSIKNIDYALRKFHGVGLRPEDGN
jgi:predicted  nucleic acid-binding Zn-ribbon protein